MVNEFFAIKSIPLKILRTIPKIWISYVNDIPHCWIPKTGFSFKLKNMVQPPNETDVEARSEWFFTECEFMFEKAFCRLIDGEMALSKLNYGPEWFFNGVSSFHSIKTAVENAMVPMLYGNDQIPNERSIFETVNIASSNQTVEDVLVDGNDHTSNENSISEVVTIESPYQTVEDVLVDGNDLTLSDQIIFETVEIDSSNQTVGDVLVDGNDHTSNENSISEVVTIESPYQTVEDVLVDGSDLTLSDQIIFETVEIDSSSQTVGDVLVDGNDHTSNENSISEVVTIESPYQTVEDVLVDGNDHTSNENSISEAVTIESPYQTVQDVLVNGNDLTSSDQIIFETVEIDSSDQTVGDVLVDGNDQTSNEQNVSQTVPIQSKNKRAVVVLKRTIVSIDQPSDLEKHISNRRLCKEHGFPLPIPYQLFLKLDWPLVKTVSDLKPGYYFKTLEELSSIPRKFNYPFCRPGPLKRTDLYHWYLVDSIVQEVYRKTNPLPFYVVRWVGYEDEFNTVEPLANVKHTAVHTLFTSPELYTACRSNNSCVLRRSERNIQKKVDHVQMDVDMTIYERTVSKLVSELRIEEEAGRYSPEIGFHSKQNVNDALLSQHQFCMNKFPLILEELKSTLRLDSHYIGEALGNLCTAAEFKKISSWCVKKPSTIKDFITRGLSKGSQTSNEPRYVAFFVPRKFGTAEKKNTVQMNFHMCVFTVRSNEGVKDAIYYDPAPKINAHGLPDALNKLSKPILQSFTGKFGFASEKDDCLFQCMLHIIGTAAGEIPFAPNLSEPCRKIDKFMAAKEAKKRKIEN